MENSTPTNRVALLPQALDLLVAWISRRGSLAVCAPTPTQAGAAAPHCRATTIPPDSHPTAELVMLCSGKARLLTAAGMRELATGQPVLILPHTLHAESYARIDTGYKVLWMDITCSGILFFISSYAGRSKARRTLAERMHMDGREALLLWELCAKIGRSMPDKRTKARLQALVLLLACDALDAGEGPKPQTRAALSRQAVKRAKVHLDANFASDVSVPALARELRLSPNHLSTIFRRESGMSVLQYVIERRIEAACKMLAGDGGLSIKEVAAAVGFRDQLYFSRVFKARTKVPPSVFRADKCGVCGGSRGRQAWPVRSANGG